VVNTHLVEGATAASGGEGDRARRRRGNPPGKGRDVWGRGVASPIRGRTRAPPGRWSSRRVGRPVDAARDGRGPGQAFGWLAVGVELASPGCYYIGIWVDFLLVVARTGC
jgi:hypothetical protein